MNTKRPNRESICKKVGVSLPDEMWAQIERRAHLEQRSKSNMVRFLLTMAMKMPTPGAESMPEFGHVAEPRATYGARKE